MIEETVFFTKFLLLFILPLTANIVFIIVIACGPSLDTPAHYLIHNKPQKVLSDSVRLFLCFSPYMTEAAR